MAGFRVCHHPDVCGHNYSLEPAALMTWLKRVNKSSGVLTKTNDIALLFLCAPLSLVHFVVQEGSWANNKDGYTFLWSSLNFLL